jgi:hypothetical protein
MAVSPTDQSRNFVESGMRLITSPSSDALLRQGRDKREAVKSAIDDSELWDPTTGPVE